MATHVPSLPFASQASHCKSQVVPQQTESTQCPEPHSASTVHVVPSDLKQEPSCPLRPHEAPLEQDAEPQHTPSTQNVPVLQLLGSVQGFPSPSVATHTLLLHQ